MQELSERNFQPFPERFKRLVELLGKTREETAKTLGVTIQAVNQTVDDPPAHRRLFVELMIEKLERNFPAETEKPPTHGADLEAVIGKIVEAKLREFNLISGTVSKTKRSILRAAGRAPLPTAVVPPSPEASGRPTPSAPPSDGRSPGVAGKES